MVIGEKLDGAVLAPLSATVHDLQQRTELPKSLVTDWILWPALAYNYKYQFLMFVLHALSRFGALVIGLSLVYVALFFTKDDDGRIQNWLVDLWVRVEGISSENSRRAVAFFNEIAALINRLLNKFFGPKVVSIQFVSVSIILSVCSLFLCCTLRLAETLRGRVWYGSLFLLVSLIADEVVKRSKTAVSLSAAALTLGVLYFNDHYWFRAGARPDIYAFSGVAIGILLDAGFVATTRLILLKVEEEQSLKKLIGGAILTLLLGAVLLAPSWPFFSRDEFRGALFKVYPGAWVLVISATTNIFAGICTLSLLIVSTIALWHRVLWGFASRLIHVCYERRVVENRVLLFTIGSTLLSYSVNWFSWLRLVPH